MKQRLLGKGVLGAALAILAGGQAVVGQAAETTDNQAAITFTFDHPGLQPSHYTLVVRKDGSGHYHSEAATTQADTGAGAGQALDRDITISLPLRTQLFGVARRDHFFAMECAAKRKNMAFTGTKTFAYAGPDGSGSCTFNYAQQQDLQAVAEAMIGTSATLQSGRTLELLMLHDKLGLDEAVERLSAAQAAGLVVELQNVVPILQEIASSDAVLNRTRTRSAALLSSLSPTR